MLFYGGRISLIPKKGSLFYQDGNEKKIGQLIDALNSKFEMIEKYSVHILHEPIFHPDKGYIGGILGRKGVTKLPDHDGNRFTVRQALVYPHIRYFFLRDEQIIIVQKDLTVFRKPEKVFEYLENYLNNKLLDIGISVFIQPLTTKGEFWNVLKKFDCVNEVRLRFIVPNFLGELYTNTSKLLEKIKEETGASEIEHTLIDQSGKINIPQDSGYQAAVGWIEDGGGSWIIKKKTSKGKKKSVSSKQSLTIFEKEISFENISVDQIAELISEFNIEEHQINRNKDESENG